MPIQGFDFSQMPVVGRQQTTQESAVPELSFLLRNLVGRFNQSNNPNRIPGPEENPLKGFNQGANHNDYFKKLLQEGSNIPEQKNEDPFQKFGTGSSLKDLIRRRESGGNYSVVNKLGYSGAYQFGAQALEDVGLLKPGASKKGNKALNDPRNWTIPGGKESFLANKRLQDTAMQRLLAQNEATLRRMGIINENTPQSEIQGLLAAAHLSGPGGVKAFKQGKNRRDAFGTPTSEYYNLGLRAT